MDNEGNWQLHAKPEKINLLKKLVACDHIPQMPTEKPTPMESRLIRSLNWHEVKHDR